MLLLYEKTDLPRAVMPTCEMRRMLVGQKALVTGAHSGIGRAVAIGLGQAGADVVVNYVADPDQAEEVVEEIVRVGGSAYAHRAEVSNEDQVRELCQSKSA